ncbi:GNAT family N-acetyltransferase [Limobrevibacterium gyesilva]|uniref:GNAT family N-acetyltransferase n=1 Tax=Limobrevibacterium gyesilva TaxID=2991712 RepID=A0AA42CHA3_9PROT|nr:GNAT family N-acetyltransferase [Limobrevibacterium gyesilva]MCW3474635.1 GNAT family N-acetyltransferase [Limobrevibacterium gyesilva]
MIAATPAHAEAMAEIHAASFPPGERWGIDAMALHLSLPGTFGMIDPQGGLVLARIAADEAEILTLAVAPPARRQGRARALLDAAAGRAAAAGARALYLEVSTANAPALALYAAAGFVEVGRRPRYYADGSDALVLRRGITSGAPPPANPARDTGGP